MSKTVFVVIHESQFVRQQMDDTVVVNLFVFSALTAARMKAGYLASQLGLIPSKEYANTWFDGEEGAELISIKEVDLQ